MSSEEIDAARYLAEQVERLNNTVTAQGKANREPSMANVIGQHARTSPIETTPDSPMKGWLDAHVYRDTGYEAGSFLTALIGARSTDADEQRSGKAALAELGLRWSETPLSFGKATTGATGATGGYTLPNNLIDLPVLKPATAQAVYRDLMTVRTGVNVRGVDLPYRLGAPPRMTFQDWNTTKENLNETYGSYSANLGTLARVMDITKQFARFSAGAAEQDVLDELSRAMILGENYYLMNGAGTGSVGSGDPTYGVYRALSTGPATFRTTHSPSASTLAGSAASGFAAGLSALASRSVYADGIIVDASTYWTLISQGTDTAGFWASPELGPTGFSRLSSGGIAFWGVPVLWDPDLNSNCSSSKFAIAAQWSRFKILRGLEARVDVSDVAGERFDKNLIGVRLESELGFDARPATYAGYAQLINNLIA